MTNFIGKAKIKNQFRLGGKMKKICIVIPAYNEERYVGSTVSRVYQVFDGLDYTFYLLVVDDGSQDKTAEKAKEAGAIILQYTLNRGKGFAKQVGFDWALEADCDAVIHMDADGQHDPKAIPMFLKCWERIKAGVVIGSRKDQMVRMPWVRYLTNRLMSLCNSLITGQYLEDSQCDFRLIDKEVLKQVRIENPRFEGDTEFLFKVARLGFRILSIPVNVIYIPGRQSRIRPTRDVPRYLWLCGKEISSH